MAKNNRHGQAACWTESVIKKLRSLLASPKQRLIFEISLWTGERMGAITQLRVEDVYDDKGRVRKYLTYRGETRKSNRWGAAKDRIVLIHDDLRVFLEQYDRPSFGFLFPGSGKNGHITRRGVDGYWRRRLKDMGFQGFSTHSSRRWVINKLARQNVQVRVIAETMGITVATVYHYLDRDPEACESAIANLKIAA
ncbi:MAG: site-specific integrase [Cyanobacteria bacterium J06631_2]